MSAFLENSSIGLIDKDAIRVSSGSTCEAFVVNVGGKIQFLKKLKDEFSGSPKHIALFTKEFEVGKSLSHPNLVRYNDFQATASGIYMLQDFVSGNTLRQKLEHDPEFFLNERKLRHFTVQLLDCLSYLHSQQIVHLDLSLDNLMFTQVNESLKVLDLGFCYADVYRDSVGKNSQFAAPEQLSGDINQLSAKTDLYAVGKILELICRKVYEPAGQSMTRRLSALMARCIQDNPEDRPASASECLKMLKGNTAQKVLYAGIAATAILSAFIFINPSARKVTSYIVRNIHLSGYDIADRSGNLYRIISEKETTCEAIGYKRPYEIDNPELVIHSHVTHFGKEYKVISIAEKAYISDTTITSVFVPEGIQRIGAQAFRSCKHLNSITLPSSIQEIGEDCFAHDSLLRHIFLPEGIKVLENNSFVDCHSLESIAIPEGVEVIEMDCFVSCHSLERIILPSTLKSIQRGVFYNCDGLRSITIPASVRSIGDYAFYQCKNLTDVYMLSPHPFPITAIFNTSGLTIHVPEESLDAYRTTPGWEHQNLAPFSPASHTNR